MKKLIAILVALAMAAMLSVTTAFAAPAESSDSLADSVITKVLDVPDGVASPAASFDFTVSVTSKPSTVTMPASTTVNIPFAAGTGTQTKVKSLDDFIGLNNPAKAFNITQAGEYVFRVVEANTSTFTQDSDPKTTENMTYSQAQYDLRIYVINGTNGLEIKAITVVDATVQDDETTTDTDEVDAAKVDPEDQDPTETDPADKVGSDFKFTNTYTKTFTDETNGAFKLTKAVTGSGDTAFEFPFTVTVTIDEATLVNGAYTLTATDNTAFTFATNDLEDTQTVYLHNGESLQFNTFPAGAVVNVVENVAASGVQNAASYTGSAAGLATGTYAKGAELDVTTAEFDATGAITVTNDLDDDDITPEGILISNLPYIALALVAIGGLVAYVVIRRKADDEA